MDAPGKGILIVFDGIDGAGKTTQVQLLNDVLVAAGEAVTCSKEPTEGPWGRMIKASAHNGRMTLGDELQAFVEDRKQHVQETINPALARGEVVILDRYYFSTVAYQGARGADIEAIHREMRRIAPEPDVTFLLDLSPSVALNRIAVSRGEVPNLFEREDSLQAVRGIFRTLADGDDRIRLIDAHCSVGEVYGTIARVLVDGVLKAKRDRASAFESCFWRRR